MFGTHEGICKKLGSSSLALSPTFPYNHPMSKSDIEIAREAPYGAAPQTGEVHKRYRHLAHPSDARHCF
jgi:hypothetical protein